MRPMAECSKKSTMRRMRKEDLLYRLNQVLASLYIHVQHDSDASVPYASAVN